MIDMYWWARQAGFGMVAGEVGGISQRLHRHKKVWTHAHTSLQLLPYTTGSAVLLTCDNKKHVVDIVDPMIFFGPTGLLVVL